MQNFTWLIRNSALLFALYLLTTFDSLAKEDVDVINSAVKSGIAAAFIFSAWIIGRYFWSIAQGIYNKASIFKNNVLHAADNTQGRQEDLFTSGLGEFRKREEIAFREYEDGEITGSEYRETIIRLIEEQRNNEVGKSKTGERSYFGFLSVLIVCAAVSFITACKAIYNMYDLTGDFFGVTGRHWAEIILVERITFFAALLVFLLSIGMFYLVSGRTQKG